LREDGEIISRKTVAKTMRTLGLVGICPKRWQATTLTDDRDTYPADLVKRHSRRVIGWAIDEHMRADLVENALKIALVLRGELPSKVILHADRGTQSASTQITIFADVNGLTRSMGYTRVRWDNAMAESFFATLKTEFYYRRIWPTKKVTKTAVGAWIEGRYNRQRRHSSIGQIAPVIFEMQYSDQSTEIQHVA
jgi:transposase InsO family protein